MPKNEEEFVDDEIIEEDMPEEDEALEDEEISEEEIPEEEESIGGSLTFSVEEMPELEGKGVGDQIVLSIVNDNEDGTFDLEVAVEEGAPMEEGSEEVSDLTDRLV